MVLALAIILALIAFAIVVFALAIMFAPADDDLDILESRDPIDPSQWTIRPLRTDGRRLAGPSFANR